MPRNVNPQGIPRASSFILAVCIVISILMMTWYAREGEEGPLHSVQNATAAVVAPLGIPASAGQGLVGGISTNLNDLMADESTLSALKEQNAALRAMVVQSEEYRQEAQRLQELLNLTDRYAAVGVTGRIIGRSTDAWNQTVTLDVGSAAGVETGMSVMAATGLIGQVMSVADESCVVRLLTDPASGAAALLQSSRAEGIVRGSLDGLLYLENINADVEVSPGDVVITSGLGGSFVRGLLIGTVARVQGSTGDAARRILVAPNATVKAMEEVTVVIRAREGLDSAATSSSSDGTTQTGTGSSLASSDTTDSASNDGDSEGDAS